MRANLDSSRVRFATLEDVARLTVMLTAEQLEAAWHGGRRDFEGVVVTVDRGYASQWERLTGALVAETDRLLREIEAHPGRTGNWQLIARMHEVQALLRARYDLRAVIHAAATRAA